MGIGFYFPGVLATALTLGVLVIFHRIERWLPAHTYAQLNVRFERHKSMPEDELRRLIKEHGFSIANLSYRLEDGDAFEYRMMLRTMKEANLPRLARAHAGSRCGLGSLHDRRFGRGWLFGFGRRFRCGGRFRRRRWRGRRRSSHRGRLRLGGRSGFVRGLDLRHGDDHVEMTGKIDQRHSCLVVVGRTDRPLHRHDIGAESEASVLQVT